MFAMGYRSAIKIALLILYVPIIAMEIYCLWHDVKTAYEWGVTDGTAQGAMAERGSWAHSNRENSAKN